MKNNGTPCFDAAPVRVKVGIAFAVAEALAPMVSACRIDPGIAAQHIAAVFEAVAIFLHDAGLETHGIDEKTSAAIAEAAIAKASGSIQ